jgi:hypothetical protein
MGAPGASGCLLRSGDRVQAVEAFGPVGAGEGSSSGGPDVPGVEGLPQRVLRVAEAWAESQAAGGCSAAGTGSEDLGGERPDVWGTPGVGGAAGLWGAVQPQAPERG